MKIPAVLATVAVAATDSGLIIIAFRRRRRLCRQEMAFEWKQLPPPKKALVGRLDGVEEDLISLSAHNYEDDVDGLRWLPSL